MNQPSPDRVAALEAEVADLRKHRWRLQAIQDIARIGAWEFDATTGRATWSQETYSVLGLSEDLPACPATLMTVVHPDDQELVRRAMAEALGSGRPYDVTYRLVFSDRPERVVHSKALAERDDAGRPLRLVGIVQDVTDRERGLAERRALAERLESAQRLEAIGGMAASVAHDFNNLLTVIMSATTLVLEEDLDPAVEAELLTVLSAGRRAAALTRRMLTASRRHALQARIVDLCAILAGMDPMIRHLAGDGVRVEWESGGPHPIFADPVHVEQVVLNLVVNARDAMAGAGRLLLRSRARALEGRDARDLGLPAGSYVSLEVEDSGCGMTPEVVSRAFEPFFTTKQHGQGTGLGLATVRRLVEEMDGCVRIHTEPGVGTTVEVTLPRRDTALLGEAAEARPAAPAGPWTVLLALGDPAVLRLARQILRRAGHVVLAAETVESALAFADHADIDVVGADILLPDGTGPQIVERLSARRPGLPCLYLATPQAGDLLRAVPTEALLDMPFTPHELLTRLAERFAG